MQVINGKEGWQIEESWGELLEEEFKKEDFKKLQERVDRDFEKTEVLPSKENIFRSFSLCPLEKLKCVIIGQDPYPRKEDALGLAFSCQSGKISGSLRNIYRELKEDLELWEDRELFKSGDLRSWASEGVLLLNSVLTYSEAKDKNQKKYNKHEKVGWQDFTDGVIKKISLYKEHLVFILWGEKAQKKEKSIQRKEEQFILKSAHPSPLSARGGFFGSKPFSKTNNYLQQHGIQPILWA